MICKPIVCFLRPSEERWILMKVVMDSWRFDFVICVVISIPILSMKNQYNPFLPVSILWAQISIQFQSINRVRCINMPSQAEMIQTIKAISEQVMESLKVLLLLLVSLAEVHATPQPVPEDQSNHLPQLMSEVQSQRYRIEEISQVLRQQRAPSTPTNRVLRNHVPSEVDSEQEWEVASMPPSTPQPTRIPHRRVSPAPAGYLQDRVTHHLESQAAASGLVSPLTIPEPAPSVAVVAVNPNIETWGQKCIRWGKKWAGVRYQEVYEQDQGYVAWIAARSRTLTAPMKDFHFYCTNRQRLEHGQYR